MRTVALKRKNKGSESPSPTKSVCFEKRVRDAIISDNKSHMQISIWEEVIDNVEEDVWYTITDVTTKDYYGIKLTTTTKSDIVKEEIDTPVDWSAVPVDDYSTALTAAPNATQLCCPDIISAKIYKYPICASAKCGKKVNIVPGEPLVRCTACTRRMLPKKCPLGLHCVLEVQHNDKDHILTIFSAQLTSFLNEEIETYCDDTDSLEERILMMENVDITYNKKNVVTNIVYHVAE